MTKIREIRRLTYSGLLAAIIAVLTAYVKVPIPAGYAHVGDGAVILSGLILGPFGAIPAAIGSALGDVLAGYGHYAIFSAIIKGVMALIVGFFIRIDERCSIRNIITLIVAFVWMPLAYLPVDSFFYGFEAALASVPGNLAQALVGIIISILLLYVKNRLPERL